MTEPTAESRIARTLAWLMLAMALALVVLQFRSLFIFPQPNSLRWFGDETWLMSEAKQQIATGIVHYPLAIGSALEHGKGLLLSMTWLSSFFYGLPVWIAGHNVVTDGRIVTAIFSAVLFISLLLLGPKFGASLISTAISILLFVSTRAFFFASHSARPDLLAGLITLAFVVTCTKLSKNDEERSASWWLVYGAVISFLSVTSSIHLLTLIGPVAVFFFWRLGGFKRLSNLLAAIGGALSAFCLLALVYYLTNGDLTLFSHSAGHVQFQDVLSSIPILRPFSRSVQFSNIIIRIKQFWSESPQIFLLPAIAILVWRKTSKQENTFAIATSIVFLSWLLLEGAEINYLIHILPLLFLWLALAITKLENRWRFLIYPVAAVGILCSILGFQDSSTALANASAIDASNEKAVHGIEAAIDSTWHRPGKPRVVTEPPSLERLAEDTRLDVMTDHFISFPTRIEPLDSFFTREHVNYVVLYNSPSYPKNRPRDDPFYKTVAAQGHLIATEIGYIGDVGRDYFGNSDWEDTLLLFQLPQTR
jgi:hypothetical protein